MDLADTGDLLPPGTEGSASCPDSVADILRTYRSGVAWSGETEPDEYRKTVERLVSAGENLIACDMASDGLLRWPGDIRLRQLKAIALSRSGASLRGLKLVRELEEEGHVDQETIGMLGSISKDLWTHEIDPVRRDSLLASARDYYLMAYNLPDGDYWSGINAATLALIAGDETLARELASQVIGECSAIRDTDSESEREYWLAATLGEANLILQNWDTAIEWYERASAVAGNRLGDIASTRRNALMILEYLKDEDHRKAVLRSIAVPAVIVFAGHMIDRPGRPSPRFPAELESKVRREILDRLGSYHSIIGFSSAACGADILFLEALEETGAEANIVLPFDEEQFIEESVACTEDCSWVPRFREAMRRARSVTVASPCKTDDVGLAYDYTNMVLLGLARMKRRELEGELVAMAVWDGRPGDGFGGTRSNIRRWSRLGLRIEQISPRSDPGSPGGIPLRVDLSEETELSVEAPACGEKGEFFRKPEIRAVMFADLVGYTRLRESQIVDYVKHFMGSVSGLVRASENAPVFSNTWGDGIFMVFRDVRDAGLFALDLCDLVALTDWKAIGLQEDQSLRIALHAGPVQLCEDPITGRPGYFGSHVGRTARIEPITEPGQVYTSEQFAALAECCGINEFQCDYVGRIPLSKGYGTFPTYHLTRMRRGAASTGD